MVKKMVVRKHGRDGLFEPTAKDHPMLQYGKLTVEGIADPYILRMGERVRTHTVQYIHFFFGTESVMQRYKYLWKRELQKVQIGCSHWN